MKFYRIVGLLFQAAILIGIFINYSDLRPKEWIPCLILLFLADALKYDLIAWLRSFF